jgi:hypothetical protein
MLVNRSLGGFGQGGRAEVGLALRVCYFGGSFRVCHCDCG